ncbi:hypothetical protein BC828DRAFT_90113 [Blastocladiella britannica]|nr:hypothetical protein BC828DRAFT_90113 [Blastocladiella britannica]
MSSRALCDYEPLKKCLAENNNDRSKCRKEWDEFRAACSSARSRGDAPPSGRSSATKNE